MPQTEANAYQLMTVVMTLLKTLVMIAIKSIDRLLRCAV